MNCYKNYLVFLVLVLTATAKSVLAITTNWHSRSARQNYTYIFVIYDKFEIPANRSIPNIFIISNHFQRSIGRRGASIAFMSHFSTHLDTYTFRFLLPNVPAFLSLMLSTKIRFPFQFDRRVCVKIGSILKYRFTNFETLSRKVTGFT